MKVLLVSNLYPNRAQPERGIFTAQKVARLRDKVEFKIISPIQFFPFVRSPSAPPVGQVPAHEVVDGLEVSHPFAWYLPRIGRRANARLYANSIRSEVLRVRECFAFDLIWATWGYPDVVASVHIGRELGVPVVASLHGSDVNYGFRHAWCRKAMVEALNLSSAVVARSEAMRHLLVRSGVAEEKVVCIYNGVDHRLFSPMPKAEACAMTGLDSTRQRILYVGNFVEVKGIEHLLRAFAPLPQPVELVLIGEGPLRADLEQLAQHLGIADRVRFLGQKRHHELRCFFNSSDALCLPSLNEGLPNVVLEAFACGLPVVASHVGGVPELIVNRKLGLMTPPAEARQLSAKLRTVLSEHRDRDAIAEFSKQFDWNRGAEKLHSLFERCVSRAATTRALSDRRRLLLVSRMFPSYRDPSFGRFNFQLAQALQKHFHIEVVAPLASLPGNSNEMQCTRYFGLTAEYPRYLGVPLLNRLIGGFSLNRCLSRYAYNSDIILASFVWPDGYAAVRLAHRLKLPVIVQAIGSDIDQLPARGVRRDQTLFALRNCDHIYAVSDSLRRRIIELGIPSGNISVILNGINPALFHPQDKLAARRQLDLPADEKIVAYVGWLSHDKGVDQLIGALSRMKEPPLTVFIGADRSGGQMAALAQSLNVEKRCRFVGQRPHDEIPTWLAAADVFGFPSLHEGCPNVVLEALACGRPVVTTNVGGIPEIAPHMPWCEIVPPSNPSALSDALTRVLAGLWSPTEIAAHSTRTWDHVAADVERLIAKV